MKNCVYNILCLLLIVFSIGQAQNINETEKEYLISNFVTGNKIFGNTIFTKFEIDKTINDSINEQLIIVALNATNYLDYECEIVAMDNNSNNINWKLNSSLFKYKVYEGYLIIERINTLKSNAFITEFYDLKTGKLLSQIPFKLIANFDSLIITGKKNNKILNFSTINKPDSVLWNFNHSGLFETKIGTINNDALLIISTDKNNHILNPYTGKGWQFKTATTQYKPNFAKAILGGFFFLPYIPIELFLLKKARTVSNLHSNFLCSNNMFFYASQNQIDCYELDGKNIWSNHLNKMLTSQSVLLETNYNIIMLNLGCGIQDKIEIEFGKPYIEVFEKSSGKIIFNKIIDTKSKINSYNLENDNLVFTSANKLYTFNSNLNELQTVTKFDCKNISILDSEFNVNAYKTKDLKHITKIPLVYKYFAATNENKIIAFDSTFKINETQSADSILIKWQSNAGYNIYYNTFSYFLTNNVGGTICRFKRNGTLFFYNRKLYYTQGNKIIIIDIDDLS